MPGMAPMRDSIRTVEGRQKTFVNWPHKHFITLTPLQLAQAGFFYTPSPEFEDRVTYVPVHTRAQTQTKFVPMPAHMAYSWLDADIVSVAG
jgi:hypothetical protein